MNNINHILVFDPITYAGGSKVATREMLDLINRKKSTTLQSLPQTQALGYYVMLK